MNISDLVLIYFSIARKEKYFDNLKLALKWNRCDVAKNYIYTAATTSNFKNFSKKQLNDLMEMAITENKADFVSLLLENGATLNAFLNKQRLHNLYNHEKVKFEIN